MLVDIKSAVLASFKGDFAAGVVQMSFLSTNIRNIAGGHLLWISVFIFVNTYILRNVYRRANEAGKRQWFIYTLGCVLGGIIGTLFQTYVIQPLTLVFFRSLSM